MKQLYFCGRKTEVIEPADKLGWWVCNTDGFKKPVKHWYEQITTTPYRYMEGSEHL